MGTLSPIPPPCPWVQQVPLIAAPGWAAAETWAEHHHHQAFHVPRLRRGPPGPVRQGCSICHFRRSVSVRSPLCEVLASSWCENLACAGWLPWRVDGGGAWRRAGTCLLLSGGPSPCWGLAPSLWKSSCERRSQGPGAGQTDASVDLSLSTW